MRPIIKKVLIFGASGLLGHSLCPYLNSVGFQVFSAGRSELLNYTLDIMNGGSVKQLFDAVKPDHVINLIAATNVDHCEVDIAMASQVNLLIPAIISKAAVASCADNIHLVQISTDQVYEGKGNHREEDESPVNVYGLSKLAGELMMDHSRTAVLRTNFYGRSALSSRPSFSDWIVNSFRNSNEITLLKDVHFSALHISSLCLIIHKALNMKLSGTYNVGCRNGISKAEFALLLAAELGLSTQSAKIGVLSDLSLRARRPLDMTLNVIKLEEALGIHCPDIREEISKTAKEYLNA
jgi:dTDP-4-dehydrorhamnose reductase